MKKTHILVIFTIIFLFSCASGNTRDIVKIESDQKIEVKNGTEKLYWEDNSLKAKGMVKNFKRHGNWTYFYKGSDGKSKMFRGKYIHGKKQGYWTEYDLTGKVISRTNYSNNVLNGAKLIFYNSGIAMEQTSYRNGIKNGKAQQYYEDGKPREICYYSNDKKHGQTNLYHPNGKWKAIGKYKMGEKSGLWRHYSTKGKLEAEGFYKKNRKTGNWTYYDEKGRKINSEKQ